tara:strand:+ start:416 stop:613 length:198 start_codon:yes stop_codon:yes gene_type:complete
MKLWNFSSKKNAQVVNIAKPEKAKATYWSQCIPNLSNPFLSKSELLNFFLGYSKNYFFKKRVCLE